MKPELLQTFEMVEIHFANASVVCFVILLARFSADAADESLEKELTLNSPESLASQTDPNDSIRRRVWAGNPLAAPRKSTAQGFRRL